MAGWAEAYATGDWLGTPAALLNADRLGRALDALAGRLDQVAGALALSAVAGFGLEAARLHWDFTSVAFCGAYADQDQEAPEIGFGHSSDHREHRRQLKVGHATTASGVPLYGRVAHGRRSCVIRRKTDTSSGAKRTAFRGKPDKVPAGGGHLSELVRRGMLPRGAARTSGAFLSGTVSALDRNHCPDVSVQLGWGEGGIHGFPSNRSTRAVMAGTPILRVVER